MQSKGGAPKIGSPPRNEKQDVRVEATEACGLGGARGKGGRKPRLWCSVGLGSKSTGAVYRLMRGGKRGEGSRYGLGS